jgi:hypothetical protein
LAAKSAKNMSFELKRYCAQLPLIDFPDEEAKREAKLAQ